MDEENKTEGNETIGSGANTTPGIQSETDAKIKQLNEETERLNRALAEHENAKARAQLGGVSVLSQEKPKEETAKEYADRILSGKI